MGYPFPPDVAKMVHERLASGQYASEDDLLRNALRALDEQDENAVDVDPAVVDGVRRGLADMKAGRSQLLAEFDADFRAKHGIPANG